MTLPPTPPIPPSTPPGSLDPASPFAPVPPQPVYTPPPPSARTPSGGARSLTIALAVAVLIAGCGISFSLGRATAPAAPAAVAGQDLGQGGGLGNPPAGGPGLGGPGGLGDRGGFGGPSVQGTVQASDGKTLTLKLANGQTVIVKLDASTTYSQQTVGAASDVATGKAVIVRVNGRFDVDGQEGGPTASSVTVLP